MALTFTVFAVFSYGYMTDKFATGTELLVANGVCCIAASIFYGIRKPNSEDVRGVIQR